MKKILLILLMLLWAGVANSTDTSITTGVDCFDNKDAATTVYCTDTTYFPVKPGDYQRDVFIKPDVSSITAGSTVSSAVLSVYMTATHDCGATFSVYRVFKPWVSAQLTWNRWDNANSYEWGTAGAENASDAGSDNSSDASGYDRKSTAEDTEAYSAYSGPKWLTFDITTLVQAWVNGTATNNGVRLSLATGDSGCNDPTLASYDNGTAGNRPKLDVTWTAPTGGTTSSIIVIED